MFTDLPDDLKQKVKDLLQLGNFTDAKFLHDQWLQDEMEA